MAVKPATTKLEENKRKMKKIGTAPRKLKARKHNFMWLPREYWNITLHPCTYTNQKP